jgi:hypothetical protein
MQSIFNWSTLVIYWCTTLAVLFSGVIHIESNNFLFPLLLSLCVCVTALVHSCVWLKGWLRHVFAWYFIFGAGAMFAILVTLVYMLGINGMSSRLQVDYFLIALFYVSALGLISSIVSAVVLELYNCSFFNKPQQQTQFFQNTAI